MQVVDVFKIDCYFMKNFGPVVARKDKGVDIMHQAPLVLGRKNRYMQVAHQVAHLVAHQVAHQIAHQVFHQVAHKDADQVAHLVAHQVAPKLPPS